MNDSYFVTIALLVAFESIVLLTYLIAKSKLTKSRFLRFLGALSIGVASALIPFGVVSLVLGLPAVLMSSVLVTMFLDKE